MYTRQSFLNWNTNMTDMVILPILAFHEEPNWERQDFAVNHWRIQGGRRGRIFGKKLAKIG